MPHFPDPTQPLPPSWPRNPSFAAQMQEQKVMVKVMIVPPVTERSLGGENCTLHRFFSLSGAWSSIANTISWNGASFYNARLRVSLPLTFVSLSKTPLSQQANICDQERFRDSEIIANSNHQSAVWTKKSLKSDVTSAGPTPRLKSDRISLDKKKVMLFLKPLSKTWTWVKWEKSITLTVYLSIYTWMRCSIHLFHFYSV